LKQALQAQANKENIQMRPIKLLIAILAITMILIRFSMLMDNLCRCKKWTLTARLCPSS
jgi:hypothetical protein